MVFIKEILLNKPGQHRSASIAYNFHLVSPQLSLKHSEETINSLKAIHFTNTQVYEYFPDWFRSGSLNSPITQVSIKLDRFIPFKVLQLVCIQKLILMHTFAWLKQQYHGLNNTRIVLGCLGKKKTTC
jgi:hypothetical protein